MTPHRLVTDSPRRLGPARCLSVDTPMHRNDPNDSTLQPAMKKATVKDVVDAVLYLAQAGHVSGEILHVDGAAPARRW